MRSWFKNNYPYLLTGAVIVGLIALALITASSGGDQKPPKVSTSSNQQGSVSVGKSTGLRGGRYYGQNFSFKVPHGFNKLISSSTGPETEQVTFVFPRGQGYIAAQPITGSQTFRQVAESYSGNKQSLDVAQRPGYLIDGKTGDSRVIIVLGQSDNSDYTIQLSQVGHPNTLKLIANTLASSLRARK